MDQAMGVAPAVRPWVRHLLLNPEARDDFLEFIDQAIKDCYLQALDMEKANIDGLKHQKRCYETLRAPVLGAMQFSRF